MGCKYIYRDAQGNPSAIYERALNKYGPEKAEEIYIKSIMSYMDTKFSTEAVKSLDDEANKLDLDDVRHIYTNRNTGEIYSSNTEILKRNIKDDTTSRKFITKEQTTKPSIQQAKERLARNRVKDSLPLSDQTDTKIDEKIKADPELLNKHMADIQRMWDAHAEWGTKFHKIAEKIIKEWESAVDEIQPPSENGVQKYIELPIAKLNEIISKVKDNFVQGNYSDVNFDWYYTPDGFGQVRREPFNKQQLRDVLKPLFMHVNKLAKTAGERIYLKPELKIFSDLFIDPVTNKGVASTIDLLAMTADKRRVSLFDFKTKGMYQSAHFEDIPNRSIMGMFETSKAASPENTAYTQQQVSSVLLTDPKYGMNVDTINTLVFELGMQEDKTEIGDKTYHADGVRVTGDSVDSSTHEIKFTKQISDGDLTSLLIYFGGKDPKKVFSEARAKGISGIIENWSGTSADGVTPNATFTKYHKESYIQNKIKQRRTNPNTKKLVMDLIGKSNVDITNKSEEEILKIIADDYDATKENQLHVGTDLITHFYDSHKKGYVIPKSIEGRHNSINAILNGLDPKTHSLRLLQNIAPEFHGIGPDVLVARNESTKAIQLISAVTTRNTKVTFQGDGSKDARSSILGKYVTDKAIDPGLFQDDLMTEARAHDFLAMKLGLAALYLNKKGLASKIEGMKVVSVMYGDKIDVTPTTVEQEISKLRQFERYGKKDFPKEYSDLLETAKKKEFATSETDHLKNLMNLIAQNADPLEHKYDTLKGELTKAYTGYNQGELTTWELKKLLGRYLANVNYDLRGRGFRDSDIRTNSGYALASKALLEIQGFKMNTIHLAKDRVLVSLIKNNITSGDPFLMRLDTLTKGASTRIRDQVKDLFKAHSELIEALRKDKGATWVGDTDKVFKNLYKDQSIPENRWQLKDVTDGSLSKAEKDYVEFFNKVSREHMMRLTPDKYKEDVLNGRFWSEGTVPLMLTSPELITKENFKNWSTMREALSKYMQSHYGKKKKSNQIGSTILMKFDTLFDGQAVDENVGNSGARRQLLGLQDLSAPKELPKNLETNLGLILNSVILETAEKENNEILLQTGEAAISMLCVADDPVRTALTIEMIDGWRELTIFSRYQDQGLLSKIGDPVNKLSSNLMFMYSIKQGFNELAQGTLKTASSLLSNSIQNVWGKFMNNSEVHGRYTPSDFARVANKVLQHDPKFNQIIYDMGILKADANDLKTPEFKAMSKARTLKSESGWYLNKMFFDASILHTFLAQMVHMGIDKAYVEKDGNWIYDETLDPRFFAYDPKNKIGTRAPQTDEELKKFSVWEANRKAVEGEGMMDKATMRMKIPLSDYERAELKTYATRVYGSFGADGQIYGEQWVLVRAIAKYKKWFAQKLANYWTPTIHDAQMYGHWDTIPDADGKYHTEWKGDDFEGILQTLGSMAKDLLAHGKIANPTRYQRENITNLTSDAIILSIMFATIISLVAGTEDVLDEKTGKVTKVKSDFAKTTFGESLNSAVNMSVQDLSVVGNFSYMGQNLFPATLTIARILKNTGNLCKAAVEGDVTGLNTQGTNLIKSTGLTRTVKMGDEILTGQIF